MSKVKLIADHLHFHCPGCDAQHQVMIFSATAWSWNRNLDKPTIRPSVMVNRGHANPTVPICHSFVTDGTIMFLTDSTHKLAGKTVDLPDMEKG